MTSTAETTPNSLIELAKAVLDANSIEEKSTAAVAAYEASTSRKTKLGDLNMSLNLRPERPTSPVLTPPKGVRRRRLGTIEGRAALLHAIAHIEFNAIDLAFDMAARFSSEIQRLGLDSTAFMTDWFSVGGDEARHFGLISDRLQELGFAYGDFPAHDGLWEAAESTAHNLLARLAVAPLILEARGLDVTPGMAERLTGAGDPASAAILKTIYEDEIGHVSCGYRWFLAVCDSFNYEPVEKFRELKAEYFSAPLKPPFNQEARQMAGLPKEFYDPK